MFERFLRFFTDNARMNYTLFVLIFALGVYSYIKMPKEIFPSFDLDMISINGGYSGASIDILDKMVVTKIEDELKNIDGIDTMTTIISPNRFTIVLELQKGQNRYNLASKIKDSVDTTKQNLPSDMNTPTVNVLERKRDLVELVLTSNKLSLDDLKPIADELKSKVSVIEGISEVNIYGDSDLFYEIVLNEQKISALGLNKNDIFNAISNISYIFPVGKIEDSKQHFYISTNNANKPIQEFENSIIKIGNNSVYLKDFATISKKYEDSSTLYSLNGKNSISLAISQLATANAIKIAEEITKLTNQENDLQNDYDIFINKDDSDRIKERLDIVISNIILGIILITVLVAVLINTRMAFIIAIGIPTSFVIAAFYMYIFGYSINMISLVGILIALGIVVDDAIVVSENIQQHIEKGMNPKEAAIVGAKEMAKPVTIASLTTVFSFIPVLLISGTLGEVMKLIPIAISALVLASLIEAFVFLPIHASHTLKKETKTLSWEKANAIYAKAIHFSMHYKKSFLIAFFVLVPFLIVYAIKESRFQMFPQFDASDVRIAIKAPNNKTLEETFAIIQQIEKDLLSKKEDFFIKSIDSKAGSRQDSAGNSENLPYVGSITIELEKLKADNFVDKFITPYLSLYYNPDDRPRDKKSMQIAKQVDTYLEKRGYKEKYGLEDLSVVQRKVGPIKTDIALAITSNDKQKIINAIEIFENELKKINGVHTIYNSISFGIDEIKLKVNQYGAKLGVDEVYLGNYLSNLYLLKKKGVAFDENGMLDIKIKSELKDDIYSFQNLPITLKDESVVRLNEIADFEVVKSFERVAKDNGITNYFVYANVDPKVVTASEALKLLEPTISDLSKTGIKISLKGEEERKQTLKTDMLVASGLAILLIMLSLLYLFNSFRDTFILMSVIPFSFLGVLVGHQILGLNLSMPSLIGGLGLAGVVINDGIIMMTFLQKAKHIEEVFVQATKRFRPIILTTVTTIVGMLALMFFPTGQAAIFQPIAIALGFGLAWGTIINLLYLPVLYTFLKRLKYKETSSS
ncbi:efflux RND transporter permease subunit [Arcobacter sp. FWKO B]|uniref:efflux RND transporter permease subunit n=1 Tax=Arcobacter sp. FWKO B TaxID=2593672 RepID=UPI0018A41E68|nr:efflux RND transporter permease subunit [Arcobacter sp. FWKO B]QOG12945.1 efflux RND transporter permease subunit [Arcobacter sp. FWKO B]